MNCDRCKSPRVPGRRACFAHLLYNAAQARKLRAARRAAGLCTVCTRPAEPDIRLCAYHREWYRRNRAKNRDK